VSNKLASSLAKKLLNHVAVSTTEISAKQNGISYLAFLAFVLKRQPCANNNIFNNSWKSIMTFFKVWQGKKSFLSFKFVLASRESSTLAQIRVGRSQLLLSRFD
jgi:hypothetical protein